MKTTIAIATALAVLAMGTTRAQGHQRPQHGAGQHGAGHHQHGAAPAQPGSDAKSRLGTEVDDLVAVDQTGRPFRLGSLRSTAGSAGQIAVLTFWCTTCMSCRRIEKEFDRLAKEYAGKGATFLMVDSNSTDSAARVTSFLQEHDLGFPVLVDPESRIAWYFGATLTTTTAVIDAEGKLRYYGGFPKAEDAVRDLLAGKPVAVAESRGSG